MKKIYTLLLLLSIGNILFSQITVLKSGMSDPQGGGLGNRVVFVNQATGALGSTDGTVAGNVDITASAGVTLGGGTVALVNGKIIIVGNTSAAGSELWASDGTIAGTVLLKDINVGAANSDPQGGNDGFIVVNNTMYFTANDGTSRKLWKTDGTPAGTVVVKDVGSTITFPFLLNPVGSTLYFIAGITGKELWKSDGTNGGTVMVKDFSPGGPGNTFSTTFIGNGTHTFFVAHDGSTGLELWRTDGTGAGTIRLTNLNGSSDGINLNSGGTPDWNAYSYNNILYFQPITSGTKLYTSDGSLAGTTLLTDINPSAPSYISLQDAVVLRGNLVFTANGELYKTNGTAAGTVLVKDINPGVGFSNPRIYTPKENLGSGYAQGTFAGEKIFLAADNGTNGIELWVSDGTAAGTQLVKDIKSGSGGSLIGNGSGNDKYFYTKYKFFIAADDGTNGIEIWQSDGTTGGTTLLSDIYTGSTSSNPDFFGVAEANHKLVFRGTTSGGDNIYALDAAVVSFPLLLTSFTAELRGSEVGLKWTTQQEVNVSHFNIQRSVTGTEFNSIGRVNATGSLNTQNYSFTDRELAKAGTLYYRLEMVDKDGKSSFSQVQRIKLKTGFSFSLSSTQSEAIINLGEVNDVVSIRVIDANGRVQFQQKQKVNTGEVIRIPISSLASGMYFVSVEYNGAVDTKRLVK